MNRRGFLRSVGAVGLTAVAGCSRRDSSTDRERRSEDARPPGTYPVQNAAGSLSELANEWDLADVVNLANVGADTTGAAPIGDLLAEHAGDGTLVYLPPGQYKVAESFSLGADARFGLVGDGATIRPPEGFAETVFGFGYPEPMAAVSVRGVTFDFTALDTGGRPILAKATERVRLEDVAVRGEIDTNEDQVRVDVTDSEGTAVVRNLSLPDGASRGSNVTGCEVGDDNHGDLSFVDCNIEGFTDNGLYADPPEGSVTVDGGVFRNNGIAGVRIQTSEASVVRGAHVVCDDRTSDLDNMRGIRLRAGEELLVEDCLVEMLAVSSSDGGVTFASELESATVRNCHVRVDADGVNAIRVKSPPSGGDSAARQGPFRCENVRITGTAAGGAAIEASNRNGCEFQGVCVTQSGSERDGLVADNVTGSLRNSHFAVTGDPISLQNSALERVNVSLSGQPGLGPNCGQPPH